jgi:hypothetical protein
MTVVPIPSAICGTCDQRTHREVVEQPALFTHGGYGATRRTITTWCPACGWELVTEVSDTRPVGDGDV